MTEGQLLLINHSNFLEVGFFNESQFATLERGSASIEDPIISLFPNQPSSNGEDIHEEFIMKLSTGLLHH
jgi:hypothetical protein